MSLLHENWTDLKNNTNKNNLFSWQVISNDRKTLKSKGITIAVSIDFTPLKRKKGKSLCVIEGSLAAILLPAVYNTAWRSNRSAVENTLAWLSLDQSNQSSDSFPAESGSQKSKCGFRCCKWVTQPKSLTPKTVVFNRRFIFPSHSLLIPPVWMPFISRKQHLESINWSTDCNQKPFITQNLIPKLLYNVIRTAEAAQRNLYM